MLLGDSCQLVFVLLVTNLLSVAVELIFPPALLSTFQYFYSLALKILGETVRILAKSDCSSVTCSLLSEKIVRLMKCDLYLASPGCS